MKKTLKNKKGFTLIELTLVIIVLGILAVTAAPIFSSLPSDAKESAADGIASAVRDGINIDFAESGGNFPAALDVQADGACTACFNQVVRDPINDARWTKAAGAGSLVIYTFTDGSLSVSYTYDPAAGTFTKS